MEVGVKTMKSRDRLPSVTPILIGFSLLLIGVAQITALWALTKVILPTSIKSPGVEEVKPTKFSPQIYQLEIVNNHIQLTPKNYIIPLQPLPERRSH